MAWESNNRMFRSLTDEEEKDFRDYAKENEPEKIYDNNWEAYHPVLRDEWLKRGLCPDVKCLDKISIEFVSKLCVRIIEFYTKDTPHNTPEKEIVLKIKNGLDVLTLARIVQHMLGEK